MNEWFKKNSFPNLLVIIVFGLLLCWGAVGHGRSFYYKTRYDSTVSELGQLRTELESANNNQRELEEQLRTVGTISEAAMEFVSREQDLLIKSGNTIQEIRAQVKDLEDYCSRLELFIYSIGNNISNTNSSEEIK